MVIIETSVIDDTRLFTLNGLPYAKGLFKVVYTDMEEVNSGLNLDKIRVRLDYIENDKPIMPSTLLKEVSVDGDVFTSVEDLISALNPIINFNGAGTSPNFSYITSNQNITLAERKGDIIYGILDQYTGEEMTLTLTNDTNDEDGVIYFDLGAEKFKRTNLKYLNVKWFGAKGDGLNNDTNAIKECIDLAQTNGGNVFFPEGMYLTDFIDLIRFNNITLEGSGYFSEFQYVPTSIIKIRTACDFGIKLATNEEVPISLATGIVIKNLFLDSNNLADIGINPCRSVKLINFKTSNAVLDGISLTGGTYPVFLEHVVSQGNGRDGLRVNAPNTTIYSVKDSEFGFNGANGVSIYDGSSAIFENVLCQVNNANGFYIYKNDPDDFETPIFLERISFINCYSEANLGWGIDINSYNTTPSTFEGKIVDLTFLNCSFNSGIAQYVRVKGTANVNVIGTPYFSEALGATDNKLNTSLFYINGISAPRAGVLFPATQIPSSDVNLLDDYKEGVFTFNITQGAGVNFTPSGVNFAKFTKIGNTVFCNLRFQWSDKGTTNDGFTAYIGNLPYIANGNQSFDFDVLTIAGDSNKYSAELTNGELYAQVRLNNKIDFSTIADFPSAGILTANFSYKTN